VKIDTVDLQRRHDVLRSSCKEVREGMSQSTLSRHTFQICWVSFKVGRRTDCDCSRGNEVGPWAVAAPVKVVKDHRWVSDNAYSGIDLRFTGLRAELSTRHQLCHHGARDR
jgi:hypothetical protein